MDKTSKHIIKYLKSQDECLLFFYDEPFNALNIEEDEFYRCIRYLVKKDLVEYIHNQDNIQIGVVLTHNAVHSASVKFDSFKSWFFHTYIGGIITGITSTLLIELLLFLCGKLIGLL